MDRKIGIIGAMQLEIDAYREVLSASEESNFFGIRFLSGEICGVKVVLCVSGVGKVNATFVTTVLALKFSVTEIINTGVSGGIGLKPLDLVIAKEVCQHDIDTSALGDPLGFISGGGFDCVFLKTDEVMRGVFQEVCPNAMIGTIATGDKFIASKETALNIKALFGAIAVDCESAVVVQAATRANVPSIVIRSISDGADEGGAISFKELAIQAAKNAKAAVVAYIKKTKEGKNESQN